MGIFWSVLISIEASTSIRMSHCRRRVTEGTEFWISCKQPAFLNNFIRLLFSGKISYLAASMWHPNEKQIKLDFLEKW